ncbi:sigma-E factor negative regulatory protein [Ottowia pentelensis]|uniref:Sigma-E factor negative regulatory protein n=1 Tax=Ottowia pentelensis TaxID=511108 RepID=A0ABV6PP75_9BURK
MNCDREQISALMDGELTPAQAAAVLAAADAAEARESWHLYHLIGDVLRAPDLGDGRGDAAFVARLRQQLPPQLAPQGLVDAPAVAVVAETRHEAANDGVFRWKMAAGFASLAAVAAIGWGVLGGIGPQAPTGGAQLASNTGPVAPATAVVQVAQQQNPAAAPAPTTPVMLRDPELDQLLAAHRQAAGVSAFGNTAGFLRAATFEGSTR